MLRTDRKSQILRIAYYGAIATMLTATDTWTGLLLYWILPYVTWHIGVQYVRLICEHSAVQRSHPLYGLTRSTIPGLLGRLLVLPRHIGYHIEHHMYPSVPLYNLPALHAALMQVPSFANHAEIHTRIADSLHACTQTFVPPSEGQDQNEPTRSRLAA